MKLIRPDKEKCSSNADAVQNEGQRTRWLKKKTKKVARINTSKYQRTKCPSKGGQNIVPYIVEVYISETWPAP